MSSYNHKEIEEKWQKYWAENQVFAASFPSNLPKYYVLDMFPYPSGSGLHVGHPLGYIASDIVARYKRHCGFNVLHPMGYDSFGLPAEQYAIQTGQHPKQTTAQNITRYREQLDRIGFSFDWSREVRTSNPSYYQWTQWIFLELFNSWYNPKTKKAENIATLISIFEKEGFHENNLDLLPTDAENNTFFNADDWSQFSLSQKESILMDFRLAYLGEAYVNWCPALGTVLANDEVKDGVSERGGHPVERKKMKQWSMRITAYADRLLDGLEDINWRNSLKESQRNWIGKSEGSSLIFKVKNQENLQIEVFTTRPDTIFGVSFVTLAPESELIHILTSEDQKTEVETYVTTAKNRSERERMANVNRISGVFTGSYVYHPITQKEIPIWVGDYVLAGYGTGAVMAVPAHDSRDYAFAKFFNLPILPVIEGASVEEEAFEAKEGILCNSDFLNGLKVKDAIKSAINYINTNNLGKAKTNYKLRDAAFGRQRYWGEPIPIYYQNGIAKPINTTHLPLVLPEIDVFLPTAEGEPPLARASQWYYHPEKGVCTESEITDIGGPIETTTMPGWAGSSWYFFRYMDSQNPNAFAGKESLDYWQQVDLYIGGSEHATGHLLYSRFWTKVLFDLGYLKFDEPAKQLINQGMIQGLSAIIYRSKNENKIISKGLLSQYPESTPLHIDVNIVNGNEVDVEALKNWRPEEFSNATFELENGKLICNQEVEKMSKRWHNVVNPDDVCEQYGADTLRLYEMFLGPLEEPKPWNTQGIEGVSRFLKKLWRLFHQGNDNSFLISEAAPSKDALKSIHKLIKKVGVDIEQFSFNTTVAAYMVCVNELSEQKCNSKLILSDLLVLLAPYAPHIAEELWSLMGNTHSISIAPWPKFDASQLVESSFNYPISINGKVKMQLEFDLTLQQSAIEEALKSNEDFLKLLNGSEIKKIIFVKGRIINIVI